MNSRAYKSEGNICQYLEIRSAIVERCRSKERGTDV
jgi:hypothetical protein